MNTTEARRRIAEICAKRTDFGFITLDDNLLASDLRALLAEGQERGEPVLWVRMKRGYVDWDENCVAPTKDDLQYREQAGEIAVPLYAAAPDAPDRRET